MTVGPLFAIATELSPHDASWRQAAAEADAVADLTAPILGFRPEIMLASLAEVLAGSNEPAHEAPAGHSEPHGSPGSAPAPIRAQHTTPDDARSQVPARSAAPGSTLAQILQQQAAQGRTLAFVLPAILDFSVFQRQALVEIVRESQRRAPSLAVHYDDVDPCHRLVVDAFAEALCDQLAGSELPPARLGVLAVASGQGDARARAEAYTMMRLLWEQLGAARGEVAFVRHARPSVPEVLERCLAAPLFWVAVPLALWPGAIGDYAGVLFDDFRRAHPEAPGLRLAPVVGASPHIRAWLAERLLALFRAHRAREGSRAPSLVHASATRESCVIGPEASCTMDILPRPLGPDLAYGPGVIAEIVDTAGLAGLLEHSGLTGERVFVKVTWHGYAPGTFTDAAALDQLLSALPGRAIVLEGHSTGRNLGGAAFDWETEARAQRAWLRDQEAEFLRRTGLADVLARHRADYVNVTDAYWDGACAPRADVLAVLAERGVQLADESLADFVPEVVLSHRGAPLISFARFKGPTRLGISNCFGLLPPPLRSRFHGPTIDHFARVCCDVARLYGALLEPHGLVEALHSAVRWNRAGLYRSRFGNYDLIANPGIVTLSRGLVAADVLASRLQGQDVRRSAFFTAVFDELATAAAMQPSALGAAIEQPIRGDLIQRFA